MKVSQRVAKAGGIPAKERLNVALYVATMRATHGRRITPGQAWREIQAADDKRREQEQAERLEGEQRLLRSQRESALLHIRDSLSAIATVRDFLFRLSRAEQENSEECAMAHSFLDVKGAQLERALYRLDVVEVHKSDLCGTLAEDLPKTEKIILKPIRAEKPKAVRSIAHRTPRSISSRTEGKRKAA